MFFEFLVSLCNMGALCTEPRLIICHVLVLVEVSPVAGWMDHDQAEIALGERVVIFTLCREANIAIPFRVVMEFSHYYLRVLLS